MELASLPLGERLGSGKRRLDRATVRASRAGHSLPVLAGGQGQRVGVREEGVELHEPRTLQAPPAMVGDRVVYSGTPDDCLPRHLAFAVVTAGGLAPDAERGEREADEVAVAQDVAAAVGVPTLAAPALKPDTGVPKLTDLADVTPLDVLPKALAAGAAWKTRIGLVSMRGTGVVHGRYDFRGPGMLEFELAEINRSQGIVGGERLIVVVDGAGSRTKEERRRVSAGRALDAPACPLPSAWRNLVASGGGDARDAAMSFVYRRRGDGRPVWELSRAGVTGSKETLDANSCVILR